MRRAIPAKSLWPRPASAARRICIGTIAVWRGSHSTNADAARVFGVRASQLDLPSQTGPRGESRNLRLAIAAKIRIKQKVGCKSFDLCGAKATADAFALGTAQKRPGS